MTRKMNWIAIVGVLTIALIAAACAADEEVAKPAAPVPAAPAAAAAVTAPQPAAAPQQPAAPAAAAPAAAAQAAVVVQPAAPAAPAQVKAALAVPTAAPAAVVQPSLADVYGATVVKLANNLNIPLEYPPLPDTPPQFGGTVRVWALDPRTWDPHLYTSYRLYETLSYSHNRLFRQQYGPGASPTDYATVPGIGESWDVSGDGKTLTVKLRDGVKWHNKSPVNGRELKTSDVMFTFDRAHRIEQAGYVRDKMASVESWEAIDDLNFRLNLKSPDAYILHTFTTSKIPIIPEGPEAEFSDYSKPEESAIGTGGFMFVSHTPGSVIVMEKNPDYWEQPYPYIDRLELLVGLGIRTETSLAAFRTGKVDIIGNGTHSMGQEAYLALKKSNPESTFMVFLEITEHRGMWGRNTEPPFDDVRVRRAISMAVDRQGWVDSVYGGYAFPGTPIMPGAGDCYLGLDEYGEASKYLQYNPEASMALLEEAGFYDLNFKLVLRTTNGYGQLIVSDAEVIVEALRDIGMDVELRVDDYDSYSQVWRDGKYDANQMPMGYTGYGYTSYDWLVHPFQVQGERIYGFVDPTLDATLTNMKQSFDPVEQCGFAQEAAKRIVDQAYFLYSPSWPYFMAWNPRVKNYFYHHSEDAGGATHLIWVE